MMGKNAGAQVAPVLRGCEGYVYVEIKKEFLLWKNRKIAKKNLCSLLRVKVSVDFDREQCFSVGINQ